MIAMRDESDEDGMLKVRKTSEADVIDLWGEWLWKEQFGEGSNVTIRTCLPQD
jgi:hypothetical protein